MDQPAIHQRHCDLMDAASRPRDIASPNVDVTDTQQHYRRPTDAASRTFSSTVEAADALQHHHGPTDVARRTSPTTTLGHLVPVLSDIS